MSTNQQYSTQRKTAVFDIETYVNYWSIAFMCVETMKSRRFDLRPGGTLDKKGIATIVRNWRIIGFNSNNYDIPMLLLAMSGASCGDLKRASDQIIMSDMRPWQFCEHYGLEAPDFLDHIDLMEVSPGSPQKPSLKMYAGRLHSKTMRDLPFDPDRKLSEDDIEQLCQYHDNDLIVTRDLYFELKPQVDLRAHMSDQYGLDLRSKSDAQVAEAVIKAEIERLTKRRLYRPEIVPGTFKYVAPSFVNFKTPMMKEVLSKITSCNFVVRRDGVVEMPAVLSDLEIKIGDGVYRMGIGGLHSSESKQVYMADDEYGLQDNDYGSFYPNMIVRNRWYPKHIGEAFIRVYKSLLDGRMHDKAEAGWYSELLTAAKAFVTKAEETLRKWEALQRHFSNGAESKKTSINGGFGKLGSPYSVLSAPNLMIQVTMTGQLTLLMMIEDLHLRGFQVISANTDGLVTRYKRSRYAELRSVIESFESLTGIGTEATEYSAVYSRDVNSYIAITTRGEVKTKGAYTSGGPGLKGAAGMKKNPTNEVCIDALVAYLKDGTPIEKTIRGCSDIRKFITIRRVNGGCVDQDGNEVGKVIRLYYAKGVTGTLKYKKNGNDVPKSEGAKPCMELPDDLPDDINYDWYIRETTAMMQDIGLTAIDPALRGRKGSMLARLGDQKTFHQVHLPSGVAKCGKVPESIRERWIESDDVPMGFRLCSKCRKADEL